MCLGWCKPYVRSGVVCIVRSGVCYECWGCVCRGMCCSTLAVCHCQALSSWPWCSALVADVQWICLFSDAVTGVAGACQALSPVALPQVFFCDAKLSGCGTGFECKITDRHSEVRICSVAILWKLSSYGNSRACLRVGTREIPCSGHFLCMHHLCALLPVLVWCTLSGWRLGCLCLQPLVKRCSMATCHSAHHYQCGATARGQGCQLLGWHMHMPQSMHAHVLGPCSGCSIQRLLYCCSAVHHCCVFCSKLLLGSILSSVDAGHCAVPALQSCRCSKPCHCRACKQPALTARGGSMVNVA